MSIEDDEAAAFGSPQPKSMSVNEALEALGTPLRLPEQPVTAIATLALIREAAASQRNKDSIQFWQKYIHQWAETKGWNQNLSERTFGDWCALFTSEISEAYEEYRNHQPLNEVYYEAKDGSQLRGTDAGNQDHVEIWGELKPCGIPIEIADLAIRVLHFCEFAGIDLNEMIALKMKYNETRAFRHGGKKV